MRRTRVPQHLSLQEQIALYSMPEPNSGCTLWLGSLTSVGYARIWQSGRELLAHRVAAYTGPIAGDHIDALAAAARAHLGEQEGHDGR